MNKAEIIQLPKIEDPRGNLSIIEQMKNIPFEIKRVHWIYDVPGGKDRGGHAYKETEEFIVALSGSFDVEIDDGTQKTTEQILLWIVRPQRHVANHDKLLDKLLGISSFINRL